jgi:hypothetical protein
MGGGGSTGGGGGGSTGGGGSGSGGGGGGTDRLVCVGVVVAGGGATYVGTSPAYWPRVNSCQMGSDCASGKSRSGVEPIASSMKSRQI